MLLLWNMDSNKNSIWKDGIYPYEIFEKDGSRVTSKEDIEAAKKDKTTEHINWAWKLNNIKIYEITKSTSLQQYIKKQNNNWVAHVVHASNDTLTKRLMFVLHLNCILNPVLRLFQWLVKIRMVILRVLLRCCGDLCWRHYLQTDRVVRSMLFNI